MMWGIIDFETTGLYQGRKDFAISMGAIVADFGKDKTVKCTDSMYSLIRIPQLDWVEDSRRFHGISPDEVAKAPEPLEVCSEYKKMQGNHKIKQAAAWNHVFDKGFFERLFLSQDLAVPKMTWNEMQPFQYAKLDNHASRVKCDCVRALTAHHALNDCARALCVYSENNGYELDTESLMNALKEPTKPKEKVKRRKV